jgi:hypothetical protein
MMCNPKLSLSERKYNRRRSLITTTTLLLLCIVSKVISNQLKDVIAPRFALSLSFFYHFQCNIYYIFKVYSLVLLLLLRDLIFCCCCCCFVLVVVVGFFLVVVVRGSRPTPLLAREENPSQDEEFYF